MRTIQISADITLIIISIILIILAAVLVKCLIDAYLKVCDLNDTISEQGKYASKLESDLCDRDEKIIELEGKVHKGATNLIQHSSRDISNLSGLKKENFKRM